MTSDVLLVHLARKALGQQPSDDDALALMLLLHTHRLRFKGAHLDDRPGVSELGALTQRDSASIVAAAWPNREEPPRTRTHHAWWYWEFNRRTAYEVVEDIPEPWRQRVEDLRQRYLASELIEAVEPEG